MQPPNSASIQRTTKLALTHFGSPDAMGVNAHGAIWQQVLPALCGYGAFAAVQIIALFYAGGSGMKTLSHGREDGLDKRQSEMPFYSHAATIVKFALDRVFHVYGDMDH